MKPKHSAALILCLAFSAVAMLFLSGCAGTSVKEDGKTVYHTQANCSHEIFKTPKGTYLERWDVDHSTSTAAGIKAIKETGTALSKVGATAVTSGFIK